MSWLGVAPIFFNCLSPRLRVSRAIRAETRESMEPPSLVRLSDKYSMRAGESPKATAVMDGRARVDVVSLTGARRLGTVSKKRCGVPAYAVRPEHGKAFQEVPLQRPCLRGATSLEAAGHVLSETVPRPRGATSPQAEAKVL